MQAKDDASLADEIEGCLPDVHLMISDGHYRAAAEHIAGVLNALSSLRRQQSGEAVERRPIMLEIAAAGDEHRKWERRWHDLQRMYAVERIFEDEDGRWGLRDFLNYAGLVCGYFLPSVTPKTEASEAAVGQIEPSPADTVNEFDGPCPVCQCRTFAAVDDEFAPGRFQRCVECKTTLDLAIYKASEPSPVDVEWVAKAGHALIANLNGYAARLSGDTIAAVRHLHNALAALQSPPVEQPAQAEAHQPSDGLVEELAACEIAPFPHSLSEYYVVLVDEGLRNRILAALKTRTSPETVELLREARDCIACDNDLRGADSLEPGVWTRNDAAELVSRIDAHLSNITDQGSDQHG